MDKIERLELIVRSTSNLTGFLTFWGVTLAFTIFYPEVLGWFERLSLGAALSWVAFGHVEVVGVLIMMYYKDKWQREARDEGRDEGREEGIEIGREEGREEGIGIGREEGIGIGREEGIEEGLERGRRETEAKYAETIRRLERQLREQRDNGKDENGA